MSAEFDQYTKPKAAALHSTTRSLPIALNRARESLMGPIREMLAKTGLTEQQWRVLRVLAEYGPQEATKLAERASLLLPSQSRIVQTLVEKGLVERSQDKRDRRRQTLAVTHKGMEIIEENVPRALELARDVEQALGREKLETLLEILRELHQLKR